MADNKSDYLELKLLDHVLGGADYVRPATVYFALYTAAPNDAGGGTEVSGGSYARSAVTNNATNFPAASGGAKTNGTDINFATPSASWGTITHMAVLDASSGGNYLYHGPLAVSKVINSGDTVRIAAGDFDLTEL